MRQTAEGVFSARLTLEAPGKATFTLIPMRHFAEPEFYAAVRADLETHDAVLCEGTGRSSGVLLRLQRAFRAEGLVSQSDHLAWQGEDNWYNADMDPRTLRRRLFRAIGWRWILLLGFLPILFVVLQSGALRREIISPSDEKEKDAINSPPGPALDGLIGPAARRVILEERDGILAGYCAAMTTGWATARIAVPWGAGHIPQLARFLIDEHGYSVTDTRWLRLNGTLPDPKARLPCA